MASATFVTPWFGVFAGGAERAVRTLALALQRRGWQVEVLTTCSGDLFTDWSVDGLPPGRDTVDGLPVRRFPLDRDRLERYRAAVHAWANGQPATPEAQRDFFTCGITSQALVDSLADVPAVTPIIAGPYFHALTHNALAAHPGRVDLLGCFHDEPQLHWSPVADMLANARRVLFLSPEEKALAVRHYGLSRGRALVESPVVGVGVELEPESRAVLEEPARAAALRRALGVPDEYFLHVGRKDRAKGLGRLVRGYEAFARRTAAPAPPLVLLGDGDDSLVPRGEAFIDLGYVGEAEKTALLAGARATLNLSTNESFSIVLMESWLAGTPVVVAADCAVTAGHCERSGGGLGVRGDAELGAALEALRDPALGALAGEAGRRYVEAEYAWDAVTDRFARALAPHSEEALSCAS